MKGYPSKRRARAAFDSGYFGRSGRTPYTNPILVKLWHRGVQKRRGQPKVRSTFTGGRGCWGGRQ